MQYEETYNLVLNIAKRLDKPRSFSSILNLLKINKASSSIFFESIKKYYDDIICVFIISRTKLASQLGINLYYEREMVSTMLSAAGIEKNDTSAINKTFEQKKITFRLPATLDNNHLLLIQSIIIANNCIEICRIGNNSDKIYEISFYAKYYLNMNPAQIMEIQKEFSGVFSYALDNILEVDAVKQKIIDILSKHGRLNKIIQNDSIDIMFRILDREIAAMEVVLKAKEINRKLDENNIQEYVTLWFLFKDLKRRTEKVYKSLQTPINNNGNTKATGTS